MPDEIHENSEPENGNAKKERIRREIAEYAAELENELKPIDVSFGKKEKRAPAIPVKEDETKVPEPEPTPPLDVGSKPVSTTATAAEEKKNKLEVLEELANMYEQNDVEIVEETVVDDESQMFDELLEEYIPKVQSVEVGQLLEVPIVAVRPDYALVDLGGKAEAVIEIDELRDDNDEINIHVGDVVKVVVVGSDEESGQVVVSHKRAQLVDAIEKLNSSLEEHIPVTGKVCNVVRSGVIVDVQGIQCFMPASQVDIARVDDLASLLGKQITAVVIDADQSGKRIIISRRRLLEEEQQKQRALFMKDLKVGENITGKVKAVMDFGVFIDLGVIDGFIPREEISWDRVNHPSDFYKEGRQAKAKIISIDKETAKITLSRRQLKDNPWDKVDELFPVGKVVRGEVVSIVNFGAFVRLTEGLTGLIHISDLSWTERVTDPRKYLEDGQRVRCVILEVDKEKQRLSLGLKQLSPDPWEDAKTNYPEASKVKGKVHSVAQKFIVVDIEEDVQGVIEQEDLSWDQRAPKPQSLFKRGQDVESMVIGFDEGKRRLKLGIKQLQENPFDLYVKQHPEKSTVTGKVRSLTSFGAFISLAPSVEGLLHVSQIDFKRVNDPKEVLSVGQSVKVKIVSVDKENKKIGLSRREQMREEERREVRQYLKSDTPGGLNLGELIKNLDIKPTDE
jgi:small subunit ribosomal protein S1